MTFDKKRYLLLLGYVVAALPLVVAGALRALDTNANSPVDWLPASTPARQAYDALERTFGAGDVVVLSWPGCTVDTPQLDLLAQQLRQSPRFRTAGGRWLLQDVVTGRELVDQLASGPLAIPRAEAIARLRGTLIGPDGRATAVIVTFTADGLRERQRLVEEIREAALRSCGVALDQQHLAGPVIDGAAVDRASQRALSRFGFLSAGIMLCVCWCCLGSLPLALLVFGISQIAPAVALALVHYRGDTMSALLIVMPPLVQVLAIAGGIHLVNYYYEARGRLAPQRAARRALSVGWGPCLLSALTTAVGLISLTVSPLLPVRCFGGYSAAGVLVAVALLLAFVPGAPAHWPRLFDLARPGVPGDRGCSARPDAWAGWTDWLCTHRRLITTGSLLLMTSLGWGLLRLNASVRIETLFRRDSRIVRDYAWLERHVGPLVPIEVVLRWPHGDRTPISSRLNLVRAVEKTLGQIDEVRGTLSVSTFLPDLPAGALDEMAEMVRGEPSRGRLEGPLAIVSRYVADTPEQQAWRVTAWVSALAPIDYGRFLDVVRRQVSPLVRPGGRRNPFGQVEAHYTGLMPLVHHVQRQLLVDLAKSFLVALAAITLVMTVVQAGIRAGLVAMVPNLFPTLILFGGMGWWGTPVDIGTVMTASVALGIAVDDTLHLLTFFRRAAAAGRPPRDAVAYAYRHCGQAMIQTTLACGLGLAVFAFCDFLPTSRFAWMMLALMTTALFGDLVVLPALLLGPAGRRFAPAAARLCLRSSHEARHREETSTLPPAGRPVVEF